MALVFWAGCSRPTEVTGVPSRSAKQPVFYNSDGVGSGLESNPQAMIANHPAGLDVSFVHGDHFGIFLIQVDQLLMIGSENENFVGSIESLLVPMVGLANSKISSIERIWLLLDRDGFDFTEMGQMPLVWVFEYVQPFDSDDLPSPADPSEVEPVEILSEFRILNPLRLAVGQRRLLDKLSSNSSTATPLIGRMDRLDVQADVSGLIVMEPIQGTIEQAFAILARFGDQGKIVSELPEQIKSFSFRLSMRDATSMLANLEVKSDRFAQEIYGLVNSMASVANSFGSAAGLPMDASGMDSPIALQLTEVMEEITDQISAESLFDIKPAGQFLEFTLRRPSRLDELVSAMSRDFLAGKLLDQRQKNLEKIADAIKAYEKQHGHLPPAATHSADSDRNLKNNWRVALLPFLGEQELYEKFDFDAPWDSPQNLEAAKLIPEVFQSFDDLEDSDYSTVEVQGIRLPTSRWHLVFGENSVYRPDRYQPKLAEIEDQKTRTALVIEGGNSSAVPWTAVQNTELSKLSINDFGLPWENGILLIDANFRVRMVKRESNYLQILTTSDPTDSLPRTAFFRQ